MEWVSSLYSILFNCFNHAHVSSKVVPPYTFGIKPPILSRISIFLFKYSISPLFHVISTSTSYIHKCNILGLGQKKMTISWVLGEVLPKSRFRFLRLDLPWDFGKKLPMSGCINSHVDLGNSLLLLYFTFFFPQWIQGCSFWDIGTPQKNADFLVRGPKSIATRNPSRNNISFYILPKYPTQKNIYLNYDQIGDRLFWPALPRAEVQMDGEANYQSRFWHD